VEILCDSLFNNFLFLIVFDLNLDFMEFVQLKFKEEKNFSRILEELKSFYS